MPYKNKEDEKNYRKKYYKEYYRIPENKEKNKTRMKLNYWRIKCYSLTTSLSWQDVLELSLKELIKECKNLQEVKNETIFK